MKFKVQYKNKETPSYVYTTSKHSSNRFLKENLDNIESLTIINESVKVTEELVTRAWNELIRRARKKYISTEALDSVCAKYTQNDTFSDDDGIDADAFYKLYDLLIDKMDEFGFELVDKYEYDDKFNLPHGKQTVFDVKMSQLAQKLNNRLDKRI